MTKRIISMFLILLITISTVSISVNAASIPSMSVSFIDCGQGDSIFIVSGNSTMLIDAGKKSNVNNVLNYLDSKNITNIDYVVSSHPDEDHIGGMPKIYEKYQVKKSIYSSYIATTSIYDEYMTAIKSEPNSSYKIADNTDGWILGNATIDVILDGKNATNSNDSSVVLKVTCGNIDLLLTGDISNTVENQLALSNENIDIEILKVAHHGSASSSSNSFLNSTTPQVAVISVGKNNSYGHPSKDALQRISNVCPTTYRTDLDGTVVLEVSNDIIRYNSTVLPYTNTSNETKVYVTATGKKYHSDSSCSNMKTPLEKTLSEALRLGYTACSKCASSITAPSQNESSTHREHTYKWFVTKAATYDSTGTRVYRCTVCNSVLKTETIAKLSKTSLAKAKVSGIKDKAYTGKNATQSVTVKLGNVTLKKGTDYTVTCNDKNIGKATFTITGIGKYKDNIKKTFTIKPKTASVKSFKSPKKKQAKVTWGKDSKVTGYQIVYATNSKFTKGKKTVTVKSYKTTSKTIKSLKSKKTYYVKVRSYKTVKGKKIYGAYSKVKKIRIK